MDIENRALLTNEQQIEVRAWEEYFSSPGYALVLQATKQKLETTNESILSVAKTSEELYYLRGVRSELLLTVAMEQLAEATYNSMTGRAEVSAQEIEDSFGANA